MKFISILLALLVSALSAWFYIFPDWDDLQHQALDAQSALPLATRELVRVSRKRGETASDVLIVGTPCLVSRSETQRNKHYVFEFRRAKLDPAVISVYVDSGPAQIDYGVTSNAGHGRDEFPWANPVPNCGR